MGAFSPCQASQAFVADAPWATKRRDGRTPILPKPPATLTERRAHSVGRKSSNESVVPLCRRACPAHGMAAGRAASRRSLSPPGDRRRAGSAKTVLSKMLRALVDPNVRPGSNLAARERDLFIAANNGHALAFDN